MLDKNLEKLAHQYFVGELGLAENEVNEASQNLLGYFQTLHQIQERLNRKASV